jgi:hypothetical protein
MTVLSNVVVEQVSTKDVNTRFGTKKTYSFKVGGAWYNAGFKDPGLSTGSVVTFNYESGKYGNDATGIVVGTATPALRGPVPSAPSSYPKGGFPIGPLDGQRSIVRQNALTNARELFVSDVSNLFDVSDEDAAVATILRIAKKFEAYTTGDADLEEVQSEMEAERKAA